MQPNDSSPTSSVLPAIVNEERFKFEAGVLCHVIGTLIAWSLGLLLFLMYRLWQDYISTILMAFIVSQTLHSHRAKLVGTLQWLRSSQSPSLIAWGLSAFRPSALYSTVKSIPALMQLFALLSLFLLSGDDVFNWATVAIVVAVVAVFALVVVALFDKKLLKFNYIVSDETLCATVILSTLLFVVSFVMINLAVYSVVDGVTLLLSGSAWLHEVSSDAGDSMRSLAQRGYEFGLLGLEQLRKQDQKWVPVASHVLEQIGSSNNRTVVVESTFVKLRECYPNAAWLPQVEDLGKLALFATARAYPANATSSTQGVLSLGWHELVDGARNLARELATELDNPGELLAMVRAHVAAAWPVLPEKVAPLLYSGTANTLATMLQLVQLALGLGATTIVFLTMTFYMLASEQDVLTLLVNKIHPAATTVTLQRMRDTIDAAIIMPITGAARNAMLSLVSYKLLGLPCKHLGAFGVIVFTLFPLSYAFIVCLPWVLALLLHGQWARAILLFVVHVATLSGHSEHELELQELTGIGDYVHAFSLVLGVYVFGLQGVLFGPMLVCATKLITDLVSEVLRTFEGRIAESPRGDEGGGGPQLVPSSADGSVGPPPPPATKVPQQTRTGHHPAGGGAPSTAQKPSAVQTAAAALGSQTFGHVVNTMRRLSFFSSPSATPKMMSHRLSLSAEDLRVRAAAAAGGGVGGLDSAHRASLMMSPAGAPERVRVSVSLGGALNGQSVRVTAPIVPNWDALLSSVAERMGAAGIIPDGHTVVSLRAADGTQVVNVMDLRDGEKLTARVAPPSQQGLVPTNAAKAAGEAPLSGPSHTHHPRPSFDLNLDESDAEPDEPPEEPGDADVDAEEAAPIAALDFMSPPSAVHERKRSQSGARKSTAPMD